jgi:hypothetical protein
VFISVTGFPSCSVIVGAPLAYEPPAIDTFAVCAVSETRWKTGCTDGSVLAGKSALTETRPFTLLTWITALDGAGAGALPPEDGPEPELLPGAAGTAPGTEPVAPPELSVDVVGGVGGVGGVVAVGVVGAFLWGSHD